jgi:hypothetical protein
VSAPTHGEEIGILDKRKGSFVGECVRGFLQGSRFSSPQYHLQQSAQGVAVLFSHFHHEADHSNLG